MKKITIYTNENCPYCKTIKETLKEKNVEFTDKVTKDHESEWKKITNLTNMPVTPTVYYEDNYFLPGRDFYNPEHLLTTLENFSKSSFSINRQSHEAIKTINYNMNVAFGRIDQLLRKIETKLNTEEDEHKSTS